MRLMFGYNVSKIKQHARALPELGGHLTCIHSPVNQVVDVCLPYGLGSAKDIAKRIRTEGGTQPACEGLLIRSERSGITILRGLDR